jgi:hypothetical protein
LRSLRFEECETQAAKKIISVFTDFVFLFFDNTQTFGSLAKKGKSAW